MGWARIVLGSVVLLQLGCGRGAFFFDGDDAPRVGSGATGGGNGGGAGGASGGGAGGGNTSGGVLGCAASGRGVPSNNGCAFCPAGTRCDTDPLAGIGCQLICNTSDDCPQLYTHCSGFFCQTNLCGAGSGNGIYYSTCNAGGTDDGICIPTVVSGEIDTQQTVGLCYQDGASSGDCNLYNASRCNLQAACAKGLICTAGNCTRN